MQQIYDKTTVFRTECVIEVLLFTEPLLIPLITMWLWWYVVFNRGSSIIVLYWPCFPSLLGSIFKMPKTDLKLRYMTYSHTSLFTRYVTMSKEEFNKFDATCYLLINFLPFNYYLIIL